MAASLVRPTVVPFAAQRFINRAAASSASSSSAAQRRVRTVAAAAAVTENPVTKEFVVRHNEPTNNVTDNIFEKLNVNLHQRPEHPLGIIKGIIQGHFEDQFPGQFEFMDDLSPIVTDTMNFDEVLVPKDHVSRSFNDTYYIDETTLLRCHTSAHQAQQLRNGKKAFLCTGDVYRRDTIDATHYPVFHQMEGVRVFEKSEWEAAGMDAETYAFTELKATLEGMCKTLFGDVEMRWVDAYFPFTEPSAELEIFFNGDWLEVLGCGVMQQQILENCDLGEKKAWAFGLGLERLAMILFDIPDIRLFWTDDKRFTSQFEAGKITKFKSYSKYPACHKDVAFWTSEKFSENNLCELVRSIGGDLVEEVKLIDEFTNPKTERTSNCFRINYRSMDRSLTNEEINELQEKVRERLPLELGVELR